jgi:hypothetical protein
LNLPSKAPGAWPIPIRSRIVFDCRMANDAASISCGLANMV